MVFVTVSANIHIFLITPGHLKIDKFLKTEYKVIYLKVGHYQKNEEKLKNSQNSFL